MYIYILYIYYIYYIYMYICTVTAGAIIAWYSDSGVSDSADPCFKSLSLSTMGWLRLVGSLKLQASVA